MLVPQSAFVTGSLAPRLRLPNGRFQSCNVTCPSQSQTRVGTVYMGRRSEKIKNRKDAQTMARTKVFARIGKNITMAAKAGGPDVVANKALAEAIEAAKAVSFPKDTMEKAIERATNADQADFKESSFEAYGHGGAAIYIDVLTDNSNRAAADIRTAINKSKMKVASPGSVAFNFERCGVIRISKEDVSDEDELLMDSIDAGAEECEEDPMDNSMYRVITEPSSLNNMVNTLKQKEYEFELGQIEMIPKNWVEISEEDMDLNMNAIDTLQALDDVDGVYINAIIN